MIYVDKSCTLVLVGAWNPAILNPNWITRNVFEVEPSVETEVLFEFSQTPGAPPRITIHGVTFIPHADKLILVTDQLAQERLQNVERLAANILNTLPHTPVKCFGQNIQFIEEMPTPDQIELFTLQDDIAGRFDAQIEVSSTSIRRSLRLDGRLLNLTCTLDASGSILFDFNFHYDVESAEEASRELNDTYYNNINRAVALLDSYGFTVDDMEALPNG